jgi:hypothetical protein
MVPAEEDDSMLLLSVWNGTGIVVVTVDDQAARHLNLSIFLLIKSATNFALHNQLEPFVRYTAPRIALLSSSCFPVGYIEE